MFYYTEWLTVSVDITESKDGNIPISITWEDDESNERSMSLNLERSSAVEERLPIYGVDPQDGEVKQLSLAKIKVLNK